MKSQRGFAALLIIFILGMVSILVASGLILTGYNESQMARSGASGTSAYYVANSGIEDAIYKLNTMANYAASSPVTYTLPVTTGNVSVTVKPVVGNTDQRTIDVTGTIGTYANRIHVLVENSSFTGFDKAIQAGAGGFELDNNASIQGGVYSNSTIKGFKNKCGNGGSTVNGSAAAVTSINAICIQGDASAPSITDTTVTGTKKITTVPALSFPIVQSDIDTFKTTMVNNPAVTVVAGNCVIGGSPDCSTLVGGIRTIGNLIINGNLTSNAGSIQVNGPIWVKSTAAITLPSITLIGGKNQIFLTDGSFLVTANNQFDTTNNTLLLFIASSSLTPCTAGGASIGLSANFTANHVVFFAPNGCAYIKAGTSTLVTAVLGYKIFVGVNTSVKFDPLLSNALFPVTKSLWLTKSFTEY